MADNSMDHGLSNLPIQNDRKTMQRRSDSMDLRIEKRNYK